MKRPIRRILRELRHSDWTRQYAEIRALTSAERTANFLRDHLQKILVHAYHNVPYYNRVLRQAGVITQDDEVDLSKFGRVSILTKEIIRAQGANLLSSDRGTRRWHYNSSGGSTGEPLRFIQDEVYNRWGDAAAYYWYKDILGIDEPDVKKVILWGSERDLFQGGMGWKARMANWLTNTVFLNSFRMTEEDMDRYIQKINSCKPDLIRGYAGSLYELCRYAERNGRELHTPKVVISAAETLHDDTRQQIERVFGTRVYDFYGSREANNLAGECRKGLMHILAFHNLVEVLDDQNRPVKEGAEGRVVVTNLHNHSMPFIRYDIGDMAVLGPDRCECVSPLPTLRRVTGRITDHFVKEDGTIVSGSALTLTFNLKDWVKAFQIMQEDYKRVRILIVAQGDPDSREKDEVERKILFLLGQDCQITWEFVDEIPGSQSGKHLYIKSLLRR